MVYSVHLQSLVDLFPKAEATPGCRLSRTESCGLDGGFQMLECLEMPEV